MKFYCPEKDEYDNNQPCCPNPHYPHKWGTTSGSVAIVEWLSGRFCRESGEELNTNEEVQVRKRTEPKWRSFGPRK